MIKQGPCRVDLRARDETRHRKLRVLHVVSGDRWAGAEVQVFTLLSQLRNRVDLHVITMNHGQLSQMCGEKQISHTVLDESRLKIWQLFASIRRELIHFGPDIIHTHRTKENVLGSVANLVSCRVKCVRTVHGAPEHLTSQKQKLQRWLDIFCGKNLQHATIAVSSELERALRKQFPGDKVYLIANGVDPNEINANLTTPDFKKQAPEDLHIGLVGRLDPVKRGDIFLEMAAILLRERPEYRWRFHVFGEGGQEGFLKSRAGKMKITPQVTFHGHRQDIRSCIAALNAVVMPSDHEGLPMAALETIALGVKLVAHATGGLVELLKNRPGALVQSHTPRSYADALLTTIEKDETPSPLERKYLASTNGDQVVALYNRLYSHSYMKEARTR